MMATKKKSTAGKGTAASSLPKIACLCPTYLRPALLAEVIECFLRQDYPADRRELIILDDAGQYAPTACDGRGMEGVRLITTRHRFRTLGEKRNATAALASPDATLYAVWDDDDIYLPWHLSATARALSGDVAGDYGIPGGLWIDKKSRLAHSPGKGLFHGGWSFTRAAFVAVGGYPWMQSGQDQGLKKRFERAKLKRVDPLADGSGGDKGNTGKGATPPSYVYRWYTAHRQHLSAMGRGGYERLAVADPNGIRRVERIEPHWTRDWERLAAQALGE